MYISDSHVQPVSGVTKFSLQSCYFSSSAYTEYSESNCDLCFSWLHLFIYSF
jgi:hypothetical protein